MAILVPGGKCFHREHHDRSNRPGGDTATWPYCMPQATERNGPTRGPACWLGRVASVWETGLLLDKRGQEASPDPRGLSSACPTLKVEGKGQPASKSEPSTQRSPHQVEKLEETGPSREGGKSAQGAQRKPRIKPGAATNDSTDDGSARSPRVLPTRVHPCQAVPGLRNLPTKTHPWPKLTTLSWSPTPVHQGSDTLPPVWPQPHQLHHSPPILSTLVASFGKER